MNLLEDMNAALFYIEEHLDDEIDMKVAAGFALCSEYHFTRMFSFLAGIPLSEYIRRRRLTLAAFKLQGASTGLLMLPWSMDTLRRMHSQKPFSSFMA